MTSDEQAGVLAIHSIPDGDLHGANGQWLVIAQPKIAAAPDFVKLSEEGNERNGFVTAREMESVLANLPDDGLRDFVCFGLSPA